jgi:hypothetical protein
MSTDQLESIDGDLITITNDATSVLSTLSKAEIDVQISTAKHWPRSVKQFRQQALELATLDEETAASCFYALPRGGKKIEGPSTRLAEIAVSCWGNVRVAARVVSVDDRTITAQGVCYDLEKNLCVSVDVQRRITDKHGRRYNDDMIAVTGMAACSIAYRNAVFRVIPFAFVKPIYEQAKLASIGKASTMQELRDKCMDFFRKAGATDEQVLAAIGRVGMDDVTLDDLQTLRGYATAIKDGEATVDEVLLPVDQQSGRPKQVRHSKAGEALGAVEDRLFESHPTEA